MEIQLIYMQKYILNLLIKVNTVMEHVGHVLDVYKILDLSNSIEEGIIIP